MRLANWILMTLVIASQPANAAEPVLVIHGGAGTILKSEMTPELEKQYRDTLEEALRSGYAILERGGTSLDAVEAAVRTMEDSPLFNAGKGAVFNHEGRNEHDACIMDGKSKKAGAVAAVTILKNPITAARAVMEKTSHVILSGRGAELFATEQGLEIVDPSYFWTKRRWDQLQKALENENAAKSAPKGASLEDFTDTSEGRFGTVGAVALDRAGNLAAATSTGGTTNKKAGRVGDTPIVGAGNYADNATCAVSGTGQGEFFIRFTVARDVAALMEYRGWTVDKAAQHVVHETLKKAGGEGGVIALDAKGNFTMPFNTAGMYRGAIRADGKAQVAIYGEEK